MNRIPPLLLAGIFALAAAWASSAHAQQAGRLKWKFFVGQSVQSSPAIGPDGTIYFGADDGKLYAVNPDGSKKWDFRTAAGIPSSPLIGPDGTLYIGSTDKVLYALKPDGGLKWLISPGSHVVATPAIGADGSLFVATVFNRLYAITSIGARKWEFNAGGNLVSSPLLTTGGNIVFGCQDSRIYAVGQDGNLSWSFLAGDKINSSPALGADGTIYVGAFDNKLYALTSEGTEKWTYNTGGPIRSSPAVGPEGNIYIGSDDGKLHAVSPEGRARWAFPSGGWLRSSPAVAQDGTVYVGSYDQKVYAVSANGSPKWEFETGGYVSSSPAIGPDGTVYVGSWDNHLYAFEGKSPLANSSWPMFRGNAAHSGSDIRPAPEWEVSLIDLDAGKPRTAPAIVRLVARSDNLSDPLVKVEFLLGSRQIGESSESPFTYIQANTPPGNYTFVARGAFASGKVVESGPLVVSVEREEAREPTPDMNRVPAPSPNTVAPEVEPGNPVPPRPAPEMVKETPKPDRSGEFAGLIRNQERVTHDSSGFVRLTLDKDGEYRGAIFYAGERHSIRGRLEASGNDTQRIDRRGGLAPLNYSLRMNLDENPDLISGVVSDGRLIAEILCDRLAGSAAAHDGRYTLNLAPAADGVRLGDGFAVLEVHENGEVSLAGRLPDGSELEMGGALSKQGVWSVYAPLAGGKGSVSGWIRFKEQEYGDVFGQLQWFGIESEAAKSGMLSVLGSRYAAPGRGKPAIDLAQGVLAFAGGGLRATWLHRISFDDRGRVTVQSDPNNKLRLKISARDGLFSGSFVHPETGRSVDFQGAVLQKPGTGAGQFEADGQAGQVIIGPFPEDLGAGP